MTPPGQARLGLPALVAGRDHGHTEPMAPHALPYHHGNSHPTMRSIVPNILQALALVLAAFVLITAFFTDRANMADLQLAAITSICLAVIGQTWPPKR